MLNQSSRQIRLQTALPESILAFKSLRMSEGLSRLFEMQFEFFSDSPSINFNDVLGHNLTVALDTQFGGSERFFNGFLTSFSFAGSHGRRYVYQGVASPWTWFLTRSENYKIFHNTNAIDIVSEVFENNGFTDYRMDLSKQYPIYEYCVQYKESDFNFISRLLEREGVYYYFEHNNGAHTMVLTDSRAGHTTQPGYENLEYFARDQFSERRRECVYGWRPEATVQATSYVIQDYDFKKPRTDLTADSTIAREHAASGFEVYEYPGAYQQAADGQTYAKTRIEELQARQSSVVAEGNVRGTKSGRVFTLSMHPVQSFNVEHLITEATHVIVADAYESSDEAEETYRCTFRALNTNEVFRPARTARKPIIAGPQTAVVVGSEGEEIDPDEFGRVRVRFHWEREASPNAFSCWVRVSQAWAGTGWGGMSIPRIGQEVVVEFEEGDPDRPIITGRVYNGAQPHPYDLPAKKNYTTFRTNTIKGSGFNEMRFDDTAGAEGIFFHAQCDFDRRVLHDSRDYVHNEQHEIVEKKEFRKIQEDRHETVEMDSHLTVGDSLHINVTNDQLLTTGGNIVNVAGGQIHLKADRSAVVEAPQGVTLKCGGSFITVNPSGVHISGPIVNINSGGSALSGLGTKAKKAEPPKEALGQSGGEKDPLSRARNNAPTPAQLDSHPVAAALLRAAKSGAPFCEICGK